MFVGILNILHRYRNLEEMMLERGLKVDHSTIGRWVLAYSPEIEQRTRRFLKPTNDSWRVDETYIKVNGDWKYLYRAVDSEGNTLNFMLSARRNKKAAKRFLLRPYALGDLSAGGALFQESSQS